MGVVVKRVYEAASASDGVRVLVDRLWPRGLTKEDAAVKFWLREICAFERVAAVVPCESRGDGACSASAISKSWPPKKASAAVEKLHHLAEGKRRVTLLYASRNVERNNATC
jgi:uncharacterized protein YeaO (DUF488 family)